MKLPSIRTALAGAADTFRRFPLAILSGLIACGAAISIIDGAHGDGLPRLLATAALGLPLFTGLETTAERFGFPAGRRWMANLLVAGALLVVFRVSLDWTDDLAPLHFLQLFVAAHLLVAVAPYLRSGGLNGFWQYNRFLLLRWLTASFYALVLWIGLAIALAALKKLFGADIPGEAFGYLMAVLGFVFQPWFFLAGVPDDFAALETREDFPIELKVFSQFVLIPLVTVYLAILTAYLARVVITRTWPSGWIGYLVSCVSLAGVLALLLVHPIRGRRDSGWVNAYGRWWFIVLIPALVMLLLAVFKRLDQYGVTESRYFLLVLGLWMLGVALYFGVTGSSNIKIIPESLLAVALLSGFGPWGAYQLSRRSQVSRLDHILAEYGMGTPSATRRPETPVSRTERAQIAAILRYLFDNHGPDAVARVLNVPRDSVLAWKGSPGVNDPVAWNAMRRMGLQYVERWDSREPSVNPFWVNMNQRRGLEVAGFEVVRRAEYPALGWIGTDTDSLELLRAEERGPVMVRHGADTLFTLDLAGAVRAQIPPDSLESKRNLVILRPIVLEDSARGYRVRLVLESLSGQVSDSGVKVQFGSGYVLAGGLKKRP